MKNTTRYCAAALVLLFSFSGLFAQTSETEMLLPIIQNGKMGYISRTGEIRIPPQFDVASHFGIPQLSDFSEGLAAVKSDKKTGYIDASGHFVVAPQFNEGRPFNDGLAAVKINDKWGYIDKRGAPVISAQYEDAGDFSEGLAQVQIAGKLGYIDKTGKIIIEARFRRPEHLDFSNEGAFKDGIANVRDGLQYAMIDRTGKIVGRCMLDCLSNFYDGFAVVQSYSKGQWLMGYMDKKGMIAIEPKFSYAWKFSEGLAPVSSKARLYRKSSDKDWYYIDHKGERAIKGDFYYAGPFSEGLAAAARDNYLKRGYIDQTGAMVIKAQFDSTGQFKGGVAPVLIGNKLGYINKAGDYVWKPSN